MKVLLLCNKVPYPANDGSSIAMRSMVEGLLKNEAEVKVMALNTLKHFRSSESIEAQRPDRLDLTAFKANTNINLKNLIANLFTGEPFHVSRFYQEHFAASLMRMLKNETFDIVQLDGLSMAVYLPLIRDNSDAKVILRAHNIEYRIWDRHQRFEKNPLRKLYLNLQVERLKEFEHKIFEEVDGILFITADDQTVYQQEIGENSHTAIPCGLNIEEYPLKKNEGETDLTYLASFDWLPNQQGVEWFVEIVWPLIKEKRPQTTFSLGGRFMPKSFKEFEKHGIKLIPEVENHREFIQGGKLAIVPLLAGSGMRIKIIENMALSMPMVSTSVGAEGIYYDDGEELIVADTAEDFAREILDLLSDSVARKRLGKKARARAEQSYLNQTLGKRTLDFYAEV